MRKNDVCTLTCTAIGADMEGVCKNDGYVVFVPGMLEGETGTVRIEKAEKSFGYGKLLELDGNISQQRVEPDCKVYDKCGGCTCRHMNYVTSLECKRINVQNALKRIGKCDVEVPQVIGMENPYHYRNKTSLPFGEIDCNPVIGFYAKRSHRVIPVYPQNDCISAMSPTGEICNEIISWVISNGQRKGNANVTSDLIFSEETMSGLLRHVVIRVNRKGESMVTLVVNEAAKRILPNEKELTDRLKKLNVVSFFVNENREKTNVIMGRNFRKVYGSDTLADTLCGCEYSLSPDSFFQVNPVQTEKLYNIALQFADISENDNVVDLYCGAGTISLLLSKKAKYVYGIEVVKSAVENAKKNAEHNHIYNAKFICGTAEEKLPELVKNGVNMDVVVVDPPRKGLEKTVIETLGRVKPDRIVYVSCNVATQARDIEDFARFGYKVEKVQSVDMFCFTSGVENVCLMTKQG